MIKTSGALKEQVPHKTDYDDNRALIFEAQGGDEEASSRATEELIKTNQGLIRNIALRFRERGTDFEDLMQIGTIGMIKAIYLQKKKREEEGKRLHISDDRFFKEAERILYDEFQYVLNIKKEELLPLIFSKIKEV